MCVSRLLPVSAPDAESRLQLGKDKFADLPLDTRHLEAKLRKGKGHRKSRPSIKDFPKEWLPAQPVVSQSAPSTQ